MPASVAMAASQPMEPGRALRGQEPALTLPQRVVAAAGASVLSALVVNPLDVVKVRMQAEAAEGGLNLAQLRSYQAYCFHRSIPVRSLQDASRMMPPAQVSTSFAAERPSFVAHRSAAQSKPSARIGLLKGAGLSWSLPKPPSAALSSHCLCAATLGGTGVLSLQEFDALPVCDKPIRQRAPGMLATFQNIVRQEGLKSLWRGLDSALLMSVPTVLLYYPMYDLLQSVLANKARDSPTATLAAPVVAGAVARTITVYAVSPLELVRVRQQAGHAPTTTSITAASSGQAAPGSAGSSGRAAGAGAGGMTTLQALRSSLGEGGGSAGSVVNLRAVSRLWTGLSATIARDVPFSAIYWGLVEPIRGTILRSFAQDSSNALSQSSTASSTTAVSSTEASTAAVDIHSVASAALTETSEHSSAWGASDSLHTQAHDPSTASTQTSEQPTLPQPANQPSPTAAAAAAPPSPATPPTHAQLVMANLVAGSLAGTVAAAATTPFDVVKTRMQLSTVGAPRQERMWSVLRQVIRQQGVQGLFVGVGPRAARCAPACAIVIACYEVLKKVLAEPNAGAAAAASA